MKLLTYAKNFLELRARAFIYALFALVGFLIGVNLTFDMAKAGIAQLEEANNAAIVRRFGQ